MTDGIDHINVYSQGITPLGRKLSNFAHTPFRIPKAGVFASVEAFWYWWTSNGKAPKDTYGFKAKEVGLTFPPERPAPSKSLLRSVYRRKLKCQPPLLAAFRSNVLPYTHYFVYNGKRKDTRWAWTGELWNDI